MLQYPEIDPVAIQLGPLAIHWYGITYLVAFLAGWWLAKYRASRPNSGWNPDEIGDVVFYIVLGVVVGGKLGSALFYQTEQLLSDPLRTLNPMNGGMSFHGGFLGVLVAFWLYGRATNRTFFEVADCAVGDGLPPRRTRRAPSKPDLSDHWRRRNTVFACMVVFQQTAPTHGCVWFFRAVLWHLSFSGGVRSRTG